MIVDVEDLRRGRSTLCSVPVYSLSIARVRQKTGSKYASCMGRKVVVKMHGQYPMKNTQMIVDNCHRAVAAAMTPAKCDGTITAARYRWCMSRAAASILVRNLTKLLQIVFPFVDNARRRYDSCIVANKLSLPFNP